MKRVAFLLGVAVSILSAESFSWHESVKVIRSEPIYRTVTIRTPVEECWNEEVPVTGSDGTLGAIIGGAAGGILGHQVGSGSGKTAATVGGAIIGTLVGKNLSEQGEARPGYRIERRCKTRYKERTENRFVGYKNYARYKGQQIVKFSDEPLKRIDVTITVSY